MKKIDTKAGFSAIELLITLFIAAAFLISGYQLYALVIKDNGEARMQAKAANVAADYLQRFKPSAQNPCVASTTTPVSNSNSISGLSNVTVTVAITCPYTVAGADITTGGTTTYVDSNGLNPMASPISGGYTIKTFTSSGSLNVTGTIANAQVLVVAGGGSGSWGDGESNGGFGGRGGAVLTGSETLTGVMTVTVGNGGQNSVFGTRTATAAGGANGGAFDTNGTNGTQSSISGNNVYYGGGGGGGGSIQGAIGGLGGGGNGGYSSTTGFNGTINTGGGGGGGAVYTSGGSGGSGIVIIKYPTPAGGNSPLSKIFVTVTYGNPQKTITSATYVTL